VVQNTGGLIYSALAVFAEHFQEAGIPLQSWWRDDKGAWKK
jgi:hypothetical protein